MIISVGFVQLGPSPNPKHKPWFWTKANTKVTFNTTTHHHHTNFSPGRDCPRVLKLGMQAYLNPTRLKIKNFGTPPQPK